MSDEHGGGLAPDGAKDETKLTGTVLDDLILDGIGIAVLEAAIADLEAGVHEDLGPNDGRRIREYLKHFGWKPPANWCAAAVGAWLIEACRKLEVEKPIAGNLGAQKTMFQFQAAGLWVPRAKLSEAVLLPGNVPVWRRGPVGTWKGHIGVIEGYDAEAREMLTIEGNSGPRGTKVARGRRSIDDERLFGVGILNDGSDARAAEEPTEVHDYLAGLADRVEELWSGSDPLAMLEEG